MIIFTISEIRHHPRRGDHLQREGIKGEFIDTKRFELVKRKLRSKYWPRNSTTQTHFAIRKEHAFFSASILSAVAA